MSLSVKFTPEIQLGQLVGALVTIASLTGWLLWGYATVQGEITELRDDRRLVQQRFEQDEKMAVQDRVDQQTRDAGIARELEKISDQIGDLRTLVPPKTK
jgi:hypothetical protein